MVEATGLAEAEAQAAAMRGLVAGVEPDAVPLSAIPGMWRAFGVIARLAGAAQLLLARRVEESPVWKEEGCRSAAEYMSRVSGGSMRAARETLRASGRLDTVPVVERAVRCGDLSVAQAEIVTDAASADPAKQSDLVDAARRLSLADLAKECARVKAAADPDPDATYRRIRAERRLRQRTDAEGAWCLHGRGTPDDGALFQFTLEPLIDEMFDQARNEGRQDHRDVYAYDALMELCRRYLNSEDARDDDGGDDPQEAAESAETGDGTDTDAPAASSGSEGMHGPGGRPAAPGHDAQDRRRKRRRRSRSNPRYLALLRIDVSALKRGTVQDDEVAEIAGIGPVPISVARDLLGDAVVKLVITKGVSVANVTHLGRAPTVAQRVALLWQTPACSNEACPHSFVQIDHREPWAHTHHTRLDTLDPLCPHCHRLKTHHNWALIEGTGKRPFVPPDDPRHPENTKRKPHQPATGADATTGAAAA